jgi:hypothetical protein
MNQKRRHINGTRNHRIPRDLFNFYNELKSNLRKDIIFSLNYKPRRTTRRKNITLQGIIENKKSYTLKLKFHSGVLFQIFLVTTKDLENSLGEIKKICKENEYSLKDNSFYSYL